MKPGKRPPKDYVGASRFAKRYAGELIRVDGTNYNRNERHAYYVKEKGETHPAKTPPHVARWAVQEFTRKNDWVLDPTMGVGTTAVEALRLGRNVAGAEIEFIDAIQGNIDANNPHDKKYAIWHIDARNIYDALDRLFVKNGVRFSLVVNNPPYSGDLRQHPTGGVRAHKNGEERATHPTRFYDRRYDNLAFLGENDEYWRALETIYVHCINAMKRGGRFVVAVKDMMRSKKVFRLHAAIGELLDKHLEYEMMTVLRHYPTTLHLNTYEKRYGVKPPLFQTVLVFRKTHGRRIEVPA
jgi:DNA modification methylase